MVPPESPAGAPAPDRPVERSGGGGAPSHAQRAWIVCAASAACLAAACGAADEPTAIPPRDVVEGDGWTSVPLSPRSARSGAFVALAPSDTGVDFASAYEWEHPLRHLFEHGFAGGGVAVGDVDGNGLPDLYVTGRTREDALYLQRAPFEFEDTTRAAGIDHGITWGSGATFGDVDRDGDLDLYVCNYDAPNLLYLNRGDGTFEEAGAARGVALRGASVTGAFADYDRDGDLDLYVVTNRLYPGPGLDVPRTESVDGVVRIAPGGEDAFEMITADFEGERVKYVGKSGQVDRLYRNDGTGAFEDVTAAAGVLEHGPGLSATWWDHDDDGWPDLYVANDYFAPDRLYHNDGDGTFSDVSLDALPHTPWFSMGAASADLDGDGRFDFVASDMSATTHYRSKLMMGDMNDSRWFLMTAEPRQYMRNALYRNTGTPRFQEAAYLAGLASTDWTWSVKLGDLDCDGRVDAFFTNGSANNTFEPDLTRRVDALRREMAAENRPMSELLEAQWELYRSVPPRNERNLAFKNLGDLAFENATDAWAIGQEIVSFGAVLADLDRDGDLDVVHSNVGAPVSILRNDAAEGRAVLLRLNGDASERFGTGATVEALLAGEGGERRIVRHVAPTSGYMSCDEALVHMGVGGAEAIDRLTVRWPSGRVQVLEDLAADRLYTIDEPAAPRDAVARSDDAASSEDGARAPRERTEATAARPRFVDETLHFGATLVDRVETPFDDYARQPLLPMRLSQSGPCLAWGDADGDGDDDVYVGGSSGRGGQLLKRRPDATYRPAGGAWANDAASEDTAALFFDADVDGDLDLFVASGSNEVEPGDPLLADRLYVNQGGGAFVRDYEALPDLRAASHCVVAADFDRDGDLDLFVGARSVPGAYPLAPESALLVNEGGRFRDAIDELAPGTKRRGMVTSALATDANGDGATDLLIAYDWGPVVLLLNRLDGEGRFEDATEAAGLAGHMGWWTALEAADVDADGDLDYVALNAGLNTKYKATQKDPAYLYYGDFEGDGSGHIVEAKIGGDELLPVRGLSCSSDAMPSIKKRIPSYDAFARAKLVEIYPDGRLDGALRLEANELASGVLVNEGGDVPRFTWRPLPRIAQIAPGRGLALEDFDGDGDVDLFVLQNEFEREPETGRWNGGVGQLLDGDGRGGFTPVEADEAGIVLGGDGAALTVTDLDGDGRPDLVAAENGAGVTLYRNASGAALVSLELFDRSGNPTAIGARVELLSGPARGRVLERRAGGGYLSQSSPVLFLGPAAGGELRVRVTWPDGDRTEHALAPGARRVQSD